jgi:hypothetical protein
MFPGSKVRLVRGADNLTAIYEPTVETTYEQPLDPALIHFSELTHDKIQ